jgi:hypothetical protein
VSTQLEETAMGLFKAKLLSAQEEGKVLAMAIELVLKDARVGTIDVRELIRGALVDVGYVRDTDAGGNRVTSILRVIGSVLEPKRNPSGVEAWARTASGSDVRAVLEKARRDRQ